MKQHGERITATGLGSSRNGLPQGGGYVYRGNNHGDTEPEMEGAARSFAEAKEQRIRRFCSLRDVGLSRDESASIVGVGATAARDYEAAYTARRREAERGDA